MATVIGRTARPRTLAPDAYERVLAWASVLLLAAVLAALVRGHAQWGAVPAVVWLHLATVIPALALTPVLLLQPRGVRRHRMLGTIWVAAMLGTAIVSLFIHVSRPNGFSIIHILSAWTLIQVPVLWRAARTHNVSRHRRAVRGMVTGALLIAGFFTFPFDRMLGHWLFGEGLFG